jgi:hypothetical protein
MIHIIAQHIGKGSYTAWYDILNPKQEYTFHSFDDKEEIEQKLIGDPPYYDKLIEKFDKINPQPGDVVVFDTKYIGNDDGIPKALETIVELSKKYNNCKIIIFDDDNQMEYMDTEHYTIFSNKFQTINIDPSTYNLNCNYYRYRVPLQEYWPHLEYITQIYKHNVRQKKMNMIIGVDKVERLEVFKYVYNIGLDTDSWLGYSGFNCNYNDSDINKKLLEFKKNKLPVILDTPMERSMQGSVNVELPPLPITMTSYVSCILETQILTEELIHVSEKSWNPFISQNIPLILGSTHLNSYLKDCGFWLAEDLFDITPKFNISSILEQYKKNLDVIHKMTMDDLFSYYQTNIRNIEKNFNLIKYAEFKYDLNKYKTPPNTKLL